MKKKSGEILEKAIFQNLFGASPPKTVLFWILSMLIFQLLLSSELTFAIHDLNPANAIADESMESVYLETTIISYLVARSSRDVVIAAHQQTTHDWWEIRRRSFECSISQIVIDEVSAGNVAEVQRRLDVASSLAVLEVTESAGRLARAIMECGAIPPRAVRDAAHIAVAAVHRIDYLLTWNCRHLANAQIMRRIQEVCSRMSERMPVICTPEALMGE